MFNWSLFLCLVLVSVPGLLLAIPYLMQRLEKRAVGKLPPGRTLPPKAAIIAATIAQPLLLVAVAAAVARPWPPVSGWRHPSSRRWSLDSPSGRHCSRSLCLRWPWALAGRRPS